MDQKSFFRFFHSKDLKDSPRSASATKLFFEQHAVKLQNGLIFLLFIVLCLLIFFYESPQIEQTSNLKYTKIDVVYTYVDNPIEHYLANNITYFHARYKNNNELFYSVMSLYKHYRNNLNNVYLVVDRKTIIPKWLPNYPVKVIYHDQIWEDPVFLPNFNSHSIESQLYRIPNLTDYFLYLNDDMIFLQDFDINLYFRDSIQQVPFHWHATRRSVYGYDDDSLARIKGLISTEIFLNKRTNQNRPVMTRRPLLHAGYLINKPLFEEFYKTFHEEIYATLQRKQRHESDLVPIWAYFLYYTEKHLFQEMGYDRRKTIYQFSLTEDTDLLDLMRTIAAHKDIVFLNVNDGGYEEATGTKFYNWIVKRYLSEEEKPKEILLDYHY